MVVSLEDEGLKPLRGNVCSLAKAKELLESWRIRDGDLHVASLDVKSLYEQNAASSILSIKFWIPKQEILINFQL